MMSAIGPLAELGQLYRRAVLDVAGRAPDVVGGWSFGGAVAQEMTAQWEEEGAPITALVAIDSPCRTATTPAGSAAWRISSGEGRVPASWTG